MEAEFRITEDGTYEFGTRVDGIFVPFADRPGTWVDGIVAAGKAGDTGGAASTTEEHTQHA